MSFTNGSGCHFKEIFDQVRKDLNWQWCFYSETKTSQRLTLYLLSSHRYIHIVLENDNAVLIKGPKVVNVKFSKTRIL